MANLLAQKLGQSVLVLDKKPHIAGNCYDYRDGNSITIHKYGSHIFHTTDRRVWEYLKAFTGFNGYMHKVIGVIDGILTHIPFNFNTLYDVFPPSMAMGLEHKLLQRYGYNAKIPVLEFYKQEDKDLQFLARYVYDKIFLNYTIKQWGQAPDSVSGATTARVPIYLSRDDRYFQDPFQGIPDRGYTSVVAAMLRHELITVRLNTDFADYARENDLKGRRIFYTGSIDEYFGYRLGTLPYRSIYFGFEEHEREYYQCNAVVNYPNDMDFTRIHEYKYYLNEKSEKTVIAKEYSEAFELGRNERYYPIAGEENQALYDRYLELAREQENVYFMGRLGDYRYYNMDQVIARAIEVFESL